MKKLLQLFLSIVLLSIAHTSFADYPLVSYRYLADPGALVYNGRVYLYCSNDDENPVEGGYEMKSIVCVSSNDLKNWTDHGVVFQVPRDASWAGKSWAPSPVVRDGKFYLYFGNGGNGIGVVTSDSPTGPFIDPNGKSLVSSETPGVLPAENMWLFDPMTFVDDDGQAYMYFGGNGENNMRVIKLNKDMISVNGAASAFKVPYFFEASWMHKNNGKYYFSYSTNPKNGMRIDYMMSDNPLTGFTYAGVMSPQPPKNSNNNHHSVFQFNGNCYQAYHNRIVAVESGIPAGYRRNLCIDQIFHNEDHTIKTMVNTVDGLGQIGSVNPFERVEAETTNKQNGIETVSCNQGGMAVTNIENGDWIKVLGVDFGTSGAKSFTASGAKSFTASCANAKKLKGSAIEVRVDSINGALLATVPVNYTGKSDIWKRKTVKTKPVTGVHDVYFVFKGGKEDSLFDFDFWHFSK